MVIRKKFEIWKPKFSVTIMQPMESQSVKDQNNKIHNCCKEPFVHLGKETAAAILCSYCPIAWHAGIKRGWG